jgi:hypothetical protein
MAEVFEARRADDEAAAIAAERIRSGAAEHKEDGLGPGLHPEPTAAPKRERGEQPSPRSALLDPCSVKTYGDGQVNRVPDTACNDA